MMSIVSLDLIMAGKANGFFYLEKNYENSIDNDKLSLQMLSFIFAWYIYK